VETLIESLWAGDCRLLRGIRNEEGHPSGGLRKRVSATLVTGSSFLPYVAAGCLPRMRCILPSPC